MNPCDIHRRSARLLRMLSWQKHCQFGLKVTERKKKNERKLSDSAHSTGRKQTDKTPKLKQVLSHTQKEG